MSDQAHRKAQSSTSAIPVPHKDVNITGRGRNAAPATPYQHQRSWTESKGKLSGSDGPYNSSGSSTPKNPTNRYPQGNKAG